MRQEQRVKLTLQEFSAGKAPGDQALPHLLSDLTSRIMGVVGQCVVQGEGERGSAAGQYVFC